MQHRRQMRSVGQFSNTVQQAMSQLFCSGRALTSKLGINGEKQPAAASPFWSTRKRYYYYGRFWLLSLFDFSLLRNESAHHHRSSIIAKLFQYMASETKRHHASG